MNNIIGRTKRVRIVKSLLIGLIIGISMLCFCIVPKIVEKRIETASIPTRQENLLSSQGEAFDSFAMADVSLTVLLDGKPHEGMSVAADRDFYVVPPNGEVNMPLAPGLYPFTAGFANRQFIFSGEVFAGQSNEFVLDVGKTPSAPELRIWDVPKGDSYIIPLEIADADEVTSQNLPDGVLIAKQNGEYVLSLDCNILSQGFWCARLTAENQYGQATLYVGFRIPRDDSAKPIYTAEDLYGIRDDLSGHYMLMNDIDMSGVDNWKPIGTENYPFSGVFNGNGHEIKGFHAPLQISDGNQFALFGTVRNAELRNVIFRDPMIAFEAPSRELGLDFRSSVFIEQAISSLVENSASVGGLVDPSDGRAGGLLYSSTHSIVIGCFNSTDVTCNMQNRYLPNTGGVMGGGGYSYVSLCANEGEIKGNHLTGGIVGNASHMDITRCINSGYIWGSTIVGAIPPGGIIQTDDFGNVTYSYFVRGQSAIGARSLGGTVISIVPILAKTLRAPEKLPLLGSFDGKAPQWTYASLDARGPVPYGIFMNQANTPSVSQTGSSVIIPQADGVRYFYTLDGSDPYTNCQEPADQLRLTLKQGQTLTVFAAKQGLRDSEIITITGGQ